MTVQFLRFLLAQVRESGPGHPAEIVEGWPPFQITDAYQVSHLRCHPERSVAESKDPQLPLVLHLTCSALQVGGFYVVPVSAEVYPGRVDSFNQLDLLAPPPPF